MECVISRLYGLTLYEGRKHSLSLQRIVRAWKQFDRFGRLTPRTKR